MKKFTPSATSDISYARLSYNNMIWHRIAGERLDECLAISRKMYTFVRSQECDKIHKLLRKRFADAWDRKRRKFSFDASTAERFPRLYAWAVFLQLFVNWFPTTIYQKLPRIQSTLSLFTHPRRGLKEGKGQYHEKSTFHSHHIDLVRIGGFGPIVHAKVERSLQAHGILRLLWPYGRLRQV